MRLSLSRDVWGGVGIVALALFLAWEASGYPFGSLSNAGPGFFPLVFSLILLGLGILMIGESVVAESKAVGDSEPEGPVAFRSMVAICAAILVFFFLLNRLGLVAATVALVFVSAFAERNVRLVRVALTAAVLALIAVVIFIYGFRLPLQAFRWG